METQNEIPQPSFFQLTRYLQAQIPELSIFIKHPKTGTIVNCQKISFFEWGFDLGSFEKRQYLEKVMLESAEFNADGFQFQIKDRKYPKCVLSINKNGSEKVKFGYNIAGDFLVANCIDESRVQINGANWVVIHAVDSSSAHPRKYWWSVENGRLVGTLDINKRSVFELFIADQRNTRLSF